MPPIYTFTLTACKSPGAEPTGGAVVGHEVGRVPAAGDTRAHPARGAAPADVRAVHPEPPRRHRRQPAA